MRAKRPWWTNPLLGSLVAILGVASLLVWIYARIHIGDIDLKFDLSLQPLLAFPSDRPPDLDVAPGAPGYIASLGTAGRQFHFHDKDADRTWIAAEIWLGLSKARMAVAEYDGPPSRELVPESVRPVATILPMLVVRVVDATGAPRSDAQVWWKCGEGTHPLAHPVEAGEVRLLVLPGKLSVGVGDGPGAEIEVGKDETVWCTFGPAGLVIDRRESFATSPARSK